MPHSKPKEKIVIAAFYSSPTKKYKPLTGDIQRHVVDTIDACSTKYNDPHYVISGDLNSDEIGEILSVSPLFHQCVKYPTRGDKILDVVVTNLASQRCVIRPPPFRLSQEPTVCPRTTRSLWSRSTTPRRRRAGLRLGAEWLSQMLSKISELLLLIQIGWNF